MDLCLTSVNKFMSERTSKKNLDCDLFLFVDNRAKRKSEAWVHVWTFSAAVQPSHI